MDVNNCCISGIISSNFDNLSTNQMACLQFSITSYFSHGKQNIKTEYTIKTFGKAALSLHSKGIMKDDVILLEGVSIYSKNSQIVLLVERPEQIRKLSVEKSIFDDGIINLEKEKFI